jgi:choline dehydrogenase-like flavoprotein
MAFHERPLPSANPQSVAQLRRSGDRGLPRVAAVIRCFLGGYGRKLFPRSRSRQNQQQRWIFKSQLPVGQSTRPEQQSSYQHQHIDAPRGNDDISSLPRVRDWENNPPVPLVEWVAAEHLVRGPKVQQQDRRVYDVLGAGPRNRFVVRGNQGPFIVHNCDQAISRDIQRHALVAQERAGYPIVMHTYDENVAEVPQGWGSVEEFERIMSDMPSWARDWPVRAAGGWRSRRYRKD